MAYKEGWFLVRCSLTRKCERKGQEKGHKTNNGEVVSHPTGLSPGGSTVFPSHVNWIEM